MTQDSFIQAKAEARSVLQEERQTATNLAVEKVKLESNVVTLQAKNKELFQSAVKARETHQRAEQVRIHHPSRHASK
jgi:hypothetical protein